MRKIFTILIVVGSLMLACSGERNDSQQADSPQNTEDYVEQAAFTNFEGDTVRVADFNGKVVMIDFWETWCRPCIASFSTLKNLENEYPNDFVVLAVTPGFTDTKKDAKAFAESHDYPFQYLMDSNKLHEKLGVQSIPFKVYVDAAGNFIKSSMGSYGPDKDYEKVKEIIEEHKSEESGDRGQNSE